MAVAFPWHIMALSKVQRLYDACDLVFSSPAGAPPTLGEIEWLRQLLGKFVLCYVLGVHVWAQMLID